MPAFEEMTSERATRPFAHHVIALARRKFPFVFQRLLYSRSICYSSSLRVTNFLGAPPLSMKATSSGVMV